ncbi:Choline-sulfatase [Planctomycetes bacterium Pan216]|uniref:Choline-sulfatase n=1 Tax=Kolteria novifilia TaxID=2527975 RepID=A0A518BAL0_9BACT|nr:Choline-sulfatase [Planctomycetes bacterium Pan216]
MLGLRVWLLMAVTVMVAGSIHGKTRAAEGKTKKPRKNVLFITIDDLNNDLGCYGDGLVKSPNIDALAKKGVTFDKAYCQYPVCNPSRSSFMTGLYPDQTGVLSNKDNFRDKNPNVTTLPQLFREHGYFVARVGKIYHYGVPTQIGTSGEDDPASWDQVVNPRGIDREVHEKIHTLQEGKFGGTLSWLNIESDDLEHTDGIGATEAIKLMETHDPKKTGQPFFLAVGFYRPHTPYVAPSNYFEMYPRNAIEPVMEKPGDRDDIPEAALPDRPKQRELTKEQRQEIIQAYYASVTYMDAQVGRLLAALKRLDLEKNTIVVFVSDHGYHLGQHGLWQKSDLFEGSARVPLIITDPNGKSGGETTEAITELVDLYPTLADLCRLPKPKHLKGRSLAPILEDPSQPGKEAALTVTVSRGIRVKGPQGKRERVMGYSIRTPRYRYTEWGNGKNGRELYDYLSDPDEFTNLAEDPEHATTVEQMESLLKSAKKRAGATPVSENALNELGGRPQLEG